MLPDLSATIRATPLGMTGDYQGDDPMNEEIVRHRKSRNTRVLIVDDDDVDRERIRRFVTKLKLPLEIVNAQNGADAITLIRRERFDIMLLDYRLGDMTGTELLATLESIDHAQIPTIMITGMGDEQTAIEAMKHGVHDYLPKKGLTAESLMSAMASALHSMELERQLHDAQENLRILSLYDSLTKLPNRNLFFDRLSQAILAANRNGSQFTILMIDLNLFKEVNDSHGHTAGDEVLSTIGDRLHAIARKSDTFARIGGDEFAAILHDVHTFEDAIACAEKINAAIAHPIAIDSWLIQVGAAIGIARYPEHGADQGTLISNADFAMYRAKRNARKFEIYSETDGNSLDPTIPVSQYLHRALRQQELFLEYQPKINLDTRELIGAEALVRWNSPEFGIIMPGNFIPMAERSDLIQQLTYLTIEMALTQFNKWRESGYTIPLALNISARILDNPGFKEWLVNTLKHHNIDCENITLEITETTLASSGRAAYKLLESLNDAGLEISIDDFGSGFTSFTAIRNIEIAELKIDRLFIDKLQSDSRDCAIVGSMLSLAASLGMRAVAEGVETEEQWRQLQKLGCHFAQGYGIARPMGANAFISWLETFNTASPRH